MKHIFLSLLAFGLFTSTANALIEVRANYTSFDAEIDDGTPPSFEVSLAGFGADAIVSLPMFPLAFGLRYENLSGDRSNTDYDFSRTAALVSWRLIDTGVLVGILGTYGLSHNAEVSSSGITTELDIKSSYSAGVEAGVKFIGNFLFAGELGYMMVKDDSGTQDMDITGPYFKAHIGYIF